MWAWTETDISRLTATKMRFSENTEGKNSGERGWERFQENVKINTLANKLVYNRI
jgi:hypothetical protein